VVVVETDAGTNVLEGNVGVSFSDHPLLPHLPGGEGGMEISRNDEGLESVDSVR
jgi:hypothetical protein